MTETPAATPTGGAAVLPPLPLDGVERVLCVVAHPDDMEYGASAAVAAWGEAGIEVSYLLLTHGEAGMDEDPAVIGPLRASEQRAACDRVGVERLTMLDHPDGMLVADLALRRDVAREIRRVRPQLVVTAAFGVEEYGALNQADHRAAGITTVDACRDAANPWVFRELVTEEHLESWEPFALLVAGDQRPTHASTVQEQHVRAAVDSLRAHAAYLEHVTGHPAPEDFIPGILREGGAAAGTGYAVTWRVHQLGGIAAGDD